ncbi:MAG: MFS transporter [Promethearchaeota archaeon]|nr:MAG: MFS transporter [Candidatus Lokiarchaeota archaeon]
MEEEKIEILHTKSNLISYGFGNLSREFVMIAFNFLIIFFYETEVGLNIWIIGLALVIFAVYNAINDPVIGYLTNRQFKFTKKYGRRKPWILLGGIPLGFCYFLVFTPPRVDPKAGAWILFGWLVLVTFLFDTFNTLFFVNFESLFPDKFRSLNERRTATGISIILGIIGVFCGSIIPYLFITFGDIESYIFQGVVVLVITLVFVILGIPGYREDQETIDRYLESTHKKIKRESFFKMMRIAFKQKSFVAYVILYTMYWAMIFLMEGSIPYLVRFILKMPASAAILIMAGYLIGAIISVPLWVKMAKKTNDNRKVTLISAILMAVFAIPLAFINNYLLIIIFVAIWGVANGGFWSLRFPIFSDIIDESIVINEKREEGVYSGIKEFFGRLGFIIQVLSFAIVHSLTGFVEGSENQTAQAIWGIHMHLAIIPMICMLIGAFVFWKWYDLKPSKINDIRLKIEKLKL